MKFPTFLELIPRIEKLSPRDPAERGLWGKMNLGQMLVHCRLPFEAALGRLHVNQDHNFLSRNVLRPLILIIPWPKGKTPTAKDFQTVELGLPVRGVTEEIRGLLEVMEAHASKPFTKTVSPALGPMNLAEWEGLQRRHLDHHLSQFGG